MHNAIANNSNISTSITGIIRVTMSEDLVLSKVVSAGKGATKETVRLTHNGNDSGCDLKSSGRCRGNNNNREFKQSATAGATMAAVTEKVWGEYVSVVC